VRWLEFVAACPQIGELAAARFRADELVFLGTIRPDGTARVSPYELDLVGDDLLMGRARTDVGAGAGAPEAPAALSHRRATARPA
jgi:hypothetical protein